MSEYVKDIAEMVGQTVVGIEKKDLDGGDILDFKMADGTVYRFSHDQDCCESVSLEDICGDLEDLKGSPLIQAECATNSDNPKDPEQTTMWHDSHTWTFYKFATQKGFVTIRWYGESNGYYSEEVDVCKMTEDEND